MKVTVDIPDSELAEVCRFTGESKKGPAILSTHGHKYDDVCLALRKLIRYAAIVSINDATHKSIHDPSVRRRTQRVADTGAQVYVSVLCRSACQDHSLGCGGDVQ